MFEVDVMNKFVIRIKSKIESIFRVIKSLKDTERRQNISKRWKPGENLFNETALSLENQRLECILEQTFHLAVERTFLISLKKKYSGNEICTKVM